MGLRAGGLGLGLALLGLVSCGGGGGGGSSPAAATGFNVRAGMQRLAGLGYSANFAVTGSCTGTYSALRSAAFADTSFAGPSSYAGVNYTAATVGNCGGLASASWVDYFDGVGMGLGQRDSASYRIAAAAESFPTAAQIGDSGQVTTFQTYDNTNTMTGNAVVRYSLVADSGAAALLTVTTQTNDNSNNLLTTELKRYRVASDGTLTPWSMDRTDGGLHFAFSNTAAPAACSAAGIAASNGSSKQTVCMMTDLGEIVLELNPAAPLTVANFLTYVAANFYDGTVVHRVASSPTYVVQGGGYTYSADGGYLLKTTRPAIVLEAPTTTGLSNVLGTIAMARATGADTATSQFFFNTQDNHLSFDGSSSTTGYAVFGRVISGIESLTALKNIAVASNGSEVSLPVVPPRILWAIKLK